MCFYSCPKCNGPVPPGNQWVDSRTGERMGTCFKQNRPEHPGENCYFHLDTGEVQKGPSGAYSSIQVLKQFGREFRRSVRGFDGSFLSRVCGITLVNRNDIGKAIPDNLPLWKWADSVQVGYRCFITMIAIQRGSDLVGFQLRAFTLKHGDGPISPDSVRTVGSAEGLYIPPFTGALPSAVVIHEGAWGAIAGMSDAHDYQSHEIFSVAVLSASVKPETIKITLDLIFPGVPRFSVFDQDQAGIKLREKTLHIAKPITINGAGPGKDYRDLNSDFRFERLSEIIRGELKVLDGRA